MDARTRKALEDSIAHWERMTADPKCGEEPYGDQCALCDLFHVSVDGDDDCSGCPVFESTAFHVCYGTPYYSALEAYHDVVVFEKDYTPDRRAAMQTEVDFLKSLRPEGE